MKYNCVLTLLLFLLLLLLLLSLLLLQVIFAVIDFVSQNLGAEFVESPPIQLPILYRDTSSSSPLIFILSPGSDPMSSFLRFAKEMDYMER